MSQTTLTPGTADGRGLVQIGPHQSAAPSLVRGRTLVGRVWNGVHSLIEFVFGVAALIGGLAILGTIPILQFLSLGYLLEVGGRISRTGRLRDGFIGIRKAARVGSIVLGTWLLLLPLRWVSSLATAAQLIDPEGPAARGWESALLILTVLLGLHIVIACSRGGKLAHFFWPFSNPVWLYRRLRRGGYYTEARDAVWTFVMALRPPYYFCLGVRCFVGTMAWLVLPVSLIALGRKAPLVGFVGALLLGFVVMHLPFLQMRFAAENRFRALFEVKAVRQRFLRAPWAFWFALFITLTFAVPLYLLKIEMIPREAAWLPSIVFIVFMFPTRLLQGWAYARSSRRDKPRHWFFRWTGRLLMVPTAFLYVLIVFFTQYTAWEGIYSLYQQHAFLLPVPFLNM